MVVEWIVYLWDDIYIYRMLKANIVYLSSSVVCIKTVAREKTFVYLYKKIVWYMLYIYMFWDVWQCTYYFVLLLSLNCLSDYLRLLITLFSMFKLFLHLRLFVFALNTEEDKFSHNSSLTFAYGYTVYSIFQDISLFDVD